MVLGSRCLTGALFMEALLWKIKMVKEVFLWEIEQGGELFIPKELSQDLMPMSFRFYDPIIAIIAENVSYYKREKLSLRQELAFKLHTEGDIKRWIFKKAGCYPAEGK